MKLKITVNDVAYEVDVEILDAGDAIAPQDALPTPLPYLAPLGSPLTVPTNGTGLGTGSGSGASAEEGSLASPVAGTVLEVRCKAGDVVDENQLVFVLETMKMKTSIAAPGKGKVAEVLVAVGDSVREGQPLLTFA